MISEPQGMTSILSIKNRVSKLCLYQDKTVMFFSFFGLKRMAVPLTS